MPKDQQNKAAPLEILRMLVELSPHSFTSASKAVGLAHNTILRWMQGERAPKMDEVERALNLFGYTLTAKPMDKGAKDR